MKKSTAFIVGAAALAGLGLAKAIFRDKTFDDHSLFLTDCALDLDGYPAPSDFHFDVSNQIWYKPNRLIVEFDINVPVGIITRICKEYSLGVVDYQSFDDESTMFLFEYKPGDGDFDTLMAICIDLVNSYDEVLDADLEIMGKRLHCRLTKDELRQKREREISEEESLDEESFDDFYSGFSCDETSEKHAKSGLKSARKIPVK